MKTDLTAQMVVCNEEQWVWYSINSVLPYVDKLIIFDTGSIDKTVAIIKNINSTKIVFAEKGKATPEQLVKLRNEQLQQTTTSWFMLLDGDEVWSEKSIKEIVQKVKQNKKNIFAYISPTIVPVGNLFHYQSDVAGKYQLKGKIGHFNIRLIRKINDYSWKGVYPYEAYENQKGEKIQDLEENLQFLENPYWHLTHLKRSSTDTHRKRKLEIGEEKKYKLPEIFYKKRPYYVPGPWIKFSFWENIIAQLVSPILNIKREFLDPRLREDDS